ncbi:MAG: phosphomannomutase [Actinobacteria bacterium]|nr:phosphomannomutase [Actinomycetota bacterium]
MRQDELVTDAAPILLVQPEAWAAADPDPSNRALIAQGANDSNFLGRHFSTKLQFGTAGLRAPRGLGPARMNRVTVRVTARAIGLHLMDRGLQQSGVVIGYDARPDADIYALDTALLLTKLGVPCLLINDPCPTPVVVWHQKMRAAAGAIVVTASHNPAEDSGYKVYGSDGTQIRPPVDQEIEFLMNFSDLPGDEDLASEEEVESLSGSAAVAAYIESVVPSGVSITSQMPFPQWVYTPLCGVGGAAVEAACVRAGFPAPVRVDQQFEPDGLFPNLPFPNPEEPGVLDAALAVADVQGAELVLANDPDGDRLAVAIKAGDGWHQLTGDELGLLLCDHQISTTSGENRLTASSFVSSEAVQALCNERGVEHVRTLTGFKWIMEPAVSRTESSWIFGYEEALGYSVNDLVLDKDGISAAIVFLELFQRLRDRNVGPLVRLDELAREIGLYVTRQASGQFEATDIEATLTSLRNDPPNVLMGSPVIAVADWSTEPDPFSANLLEFRSASGVRMAIRPSGTEPKVKIYLEHFVAAPRGNLQDLREGSSELLKSLGAEALSWFDGEV